MVTVNIGISGSSSASGINVPISITANSGSAAGPATTFSSATGSFPVSSGSTYVVTFPPRFVDSANRIWTIGTIVTGSVLVITSLSGPANNVLTGNGSIAGGINVNYSVLQSPWGGDSLARATDLTTDYDSPDSELKFAGGARDGAMIIRHAVSPSPA
jgi:hypothetical protein